MGEGSTKTKTPSFHKVFGGDFTNQLPIPRAFLKHFNGKLPKELFLKSTIRRYWHVEMKKVEKDLVFGDGWEKFVKRHSLEYGDSLVFRYNGMCTFNVEIFDRNSDCEREISRKKTNVESNSPNKRQKVDEKCAKVPRFNERDSDVKEKKNIVEPISHYKKKNVHVATEKCTKVDPPCFNGNGAKDKEKKKMATSTSAYVKPRRLPIIQIEENDDVDPYSCFIAACRPCTRQSLTVPRMVAEENGFKKKKNVKLRDPNDRLWQVKINRRCDGRFVLEQGWNAFWNEHNLGGGEICRFKFMEGLDNDEISVEIFRGGFKEYQWKRGRHVKSIREATLKTESIDIENRNKEQVEKPRTRLISVKEESDDSSM